jgi:hypothetical protein
MKALFLPDYPDKEFYTIVAIFMRLGYFATTDQNDSFDFAVSWQDATWVEQSSILEEVSLRRPVLNLQCRDISKNRVEEVFREVFGYSTFIDPFTSEGQCVEKFDENAQGGRIIDLPIKEADSRFVYQKFIDTRRGDKMIEYRVPIVLGTIPVTYRAEKDIPTDRIKTGKQGVSLVEPHDVFSVGESRLILEFCSKMGLEFGELDILRANDDSRLYILDANKTPGGFGIQNKVNWALTDRSSAIEKLAAAFKAGIETRLGS